MPEWLKKKADIEAEKKEAELKQVEINRRNAFQKEADPLFFKVQRGEAEQSKYDNLVDEIRRRFPYPE